MLKFNDNINSNVNVIGDHYIHVVGKFKDPCTVTNVLAMLYSFIVPGSLPNQLEILYTGQLTINSQDHCSVITTLCDI